MPARRGTTCSACTGAPAAASTRKRVGLGVEGIDLAAALDQWRPMPVGLASARRTPAAAVN